MMQDNVWNYEEVEDYLTGLANFADSGDKQRRLMNLLVRALRKPLLKNKNCLVVLQELPTDSPVWLVENFNRGEVFQTFSSERTHAQYGDKIAHVRDWLKGAIEREEAWTFQRAPNEVTHFKTIEEAYQKAEVVSVALRKQHEEMNVDPTAGTSIAMVFGDGWVVRHLQSSEARKWEGSKLHHCVGDGAYEDSGSEVYSLRGPDGKPRATLEVQQGILKQCRGYENQPPGEDVFAFIKDFVTKNNLSLEERPELTGLVAWQDKMYSLFDMPEGIELDVLDLGYIKRQLFLAQGTKVRVLRLPASHIPADKDKARIQSNVVLPENLTFDELVYYKHQKNKLHNADGPAYVEYHKDGCVMLEIWSIEGKRHRDNGAAYLEYYENGEIKREVWWVNGKYHKANGPAEVEYYPSGNVKREVWWKNNQQYKKNSPSHVEYYENGQIKKEVWYGLPPKSSFLPHREEGPAILEYYENGSIMAKRWYFNGKRHKFEGPAHVEYLENGAIGKCQWWINGKKIEKSLIKQSLRR